MSNHLKSTRALLVMKVIVAALLLQMSGDSETPKTKDPVLGKWRWTDKQVVECLEDGTFSVSPTNRHGKWRALETKNEELKYEFKWDEGLFVDVMLMSRTQKELTGKNNDKKKITATKIEE